ncbi:two-component system C4-dicarboxylate transport sensor histidine kinase DctB [Azomonas macrocytogenes]|uniref:C4-dicarboxylate transport sensor protein DctB n=2 Tax=Azomonas macrocytogenes TaxID=69962 RepID=A0A839SZL7_AZOMA|nr:ATP-binding protein [Azomonas macrocytogenes]MBB3102592.1 two-component system C4-dicarboxylate transport sensor histidine kinase DctB [Azomonas macrocytogenes]
MIRLFESRPRWHSLFILALVLTPLLWPLQHLAGRYYTNELTEQNRQTLDLYVANLLGTLRRYEVLPGILGDLPVLRNALYRPDELQTVAQANQLLYELRERTNADVIYLMDSTGKTLSASNSAASDNFIGRNFSFRPYFQQAMGGEQGHFFGFGTTSSKRGYFFSAAIREGERILGVLVIKLDLDHTENLWGQTPEQLMVTDSFGVVVLTSRPDWRFRATRPLNPEEHEQIALHRAYPTTNPPPLTLNFDTWLIQSRELPEIGWTVRILAPESMIERPVRTVVAIGGATLLALLLWLGLLMQRRRHFLERLALETQLRRDLEVRVQERTYDLEALNKRLKEEVLEREQAQQELVRAQDELLQAGKLSALGTMSASISHELNQPLAAIRSYADNAGVLLDHGRNEDARANLCQISGLTARMASIIAHLRAFARRDQHAPERVALQPALDDSLAMLARQRQSMSVELIRDLPEATLWVQAGETRLRQVLANLLSNALDALNETPRPRRIWISAVRQEDETVLTIRDNGPGFTHEALERAREPFFTTKARAEGLGLGLAICDSLVRGFGAKLGIANHPQGGAQLSLHLRRADPDNGSDFSNEDHH